MILETSTLSLCLWSDSMGMIVWTEFLVGLLLLVLHPGLELLPDWLKKLQVVYAALLAAMLVDVNMPSLFPVGSPHLVMAALLLGSFLAIILVLDAGFRTLPVIPALAMRLVAAAQARKSKRPTA
jgi:hypothetical protein